MPKVRQKIRSFFSKTGQFLAYFGQTLRKFAAFLLSFVHDFLVFGGISIIIWTNFRLNEWFGWYSLGCVLLAAGILILLTRQRKRK